MDPIVFAMPGNERQAAAIAACLSGRPGEAEVRRFPDGESYVRLLQPVAGCEAMVVCTLDRPDAKLVPLLWLAAAAREGGAVRVGLVAPYLAYMRQDKVFQTGEIVSARHFAALLGAGFDWLVTVDPHLHRIASLGEIFTKPAIAVHAAPAIASWIRQAVRAPLLVGPDEESQQWVDDIASRCGADSIVLAKQRFGDHEVSIDASCLPAAAGRTPILVDDMVSTARTMLAAARLLREHGYPTPVCVGIHALFAEAAYAELRAAAADIITCETIAHPSNRIPVAEQLAAGIRLALQMPAGSGESS
ncbi:ribose-phosphate pyrophosphokinase [Cupriavidus sp. AcVe19-1a]|uniref:ribose-phosphate pyrophosphokinase n=1 Tax=Cupriavidus sp. AcVe19-1a TaxID=2821359 RepID=UPI001AE195F4|nr:ribose-phosphate pyrophosphokinase [Cupriavidus sp. AcVe19-1a]MBP0630743.1 ribose-phosphate pyrophosphokinase [Cupriavidus sp. AcVe19-1a]